VGKGEDQSLPDGGTVRGGTQRRKGREIWYLVRVYNRGKKKCDHCRIISARGQKGDADVIKKLVQIKGGKDRKKSTREDQMKGETTSNFWKGGKKKKGGFRERGEGRAFFQI